MNPPKIQALLKQIESGQLKSNNSKVLNHIIHNQGSCLDHMRVDLNIPHQTVSSCISHLEDAGFIYADGTINTGEREYTVYKYENKDFMHHFRARNKRLEKFEAWKKRGLKEFSSQMHPNLLTQLTNPTLF